MPKINHICLITSCIKPNTRSGPITKFTKEERIKQLTDNVNYLLGTKLFSDIYIIDPFLSNEENTKQFNSDLLENGLIKLNKIRYLKFNPNKKTESKINEMGKGYSELKMIIESNITIKKNHKNCIVHKISGRYKIINIREIVKKSELLKKREKLLFLNFSRLLSKCYTVLFSYKTNLNEEIFSLCLKDINDKENKYSEHSFYKNIVKNKIAYRNNIVPKFEFTMLGGSNQGRYGRFKQFINKYLYGYI